MEGGGGLGEDDLQKHIVFRFAGLMEHWEWAHALPKPADAVFKNLWGKGNPRGDFMTPSLGVESHDPITGSRISGGDLMTPPLGVEWRGSLL